MFDPFNFCEKLYKTSTGGIIRHNAVGVCDMESLKTWAIDHWDEIELFPGPSNEELLAQCISNRKKAYSIESDPLKNEADFDSINSGLPPDYSEWIAKVQEIKDRYPKP